MPASPVRPLPLNIPAPADPIPTSPELSSEPPPRVLRARGRGIRGRGRGRARAARARAAPPVQVLLPAFSEARKITTPGKKYDVEYFGGDYPGNFRVLEFKYRHNGNLRCEHQGPTPHVKTYRPDRIGRVRELAEPSSSSMTRSEAVGSALRPNLRAAAFG